MIEREDREGGIRVLRLAHNKANALDLELLAAVEEALAEAEGDGSRALVLTGSGSIFSAGVNLFRVLDGGAAYLEDFLPALDSGLRRLITCPLPLVAAINGHAIAGGWVVACACDYRVMADGYGKLGLPELQVGVAFPPLVVEIVRAVTPPQFLQELMLGGSTFTGEEARRRGLVQEAVAPEQVVDRAAEVGRRLAAVPAAAFRLTKEQLALPLLRRAAAGDEAVREQVHAVWKAPATLEVIRAYLERTVGRGGGATVAPHQPSR
ncbi:MAG TPA: enoyl-CoA hydratase/isomerase family protein [Thermoanaerobaculia bacterium]|nr:enoyl-CoA hydratase/isomerase family protein [Thermoanaerobaculia bacterium]